MDFKLPPVEDFSWDAELPDVPTEWKEDIFTGCRCSAFIVAVRYCQARDLFEIAHLDGRIETFCPVILAEEVRDRYLYGTDYWVGAAFIDSGFNIELLRDRQIARSDSPKEIAERGRINEARCKYVCPLCGYPSLYDA